MVAVKRLNLDVLKPHAPNALEFAKHLASVGDDYAIQLVVLEVDEKTETLNIVITGSDIDFSAIVQAIQEMGASLHSIDEVEVVNTNQSTAV